MSGKGMEYGLHFWDRGGTTKKKRKEKTYFIITDYRFEICHRSITGII
jgi:hypothetical protein